MFDTLGPQLTLCSLPAHSAERIPEHMETSILFMGAPRRLRKFRGHPLMPAEVQ